MRCIQSLGNHEFDHGVSGLTPFIKNLSCPVLAANLVLTNVPELEKETNLRKSVVFNISGTSVGVIGYLTPETKILAVKNDVEYVDEIVAIKDEIKRLKAQGVNIIIGLGHSGYLKDLEIAKEVDGLNLVIGGHSNTFLWNGTSPDSEKIQAPYPTYVTQASGKQVPVVQAYAYTKYLGKLHMEFNNRGDLLSVEGVPILLDNTIPQDPDVLEIIERYRTQILNYTEEIIGKSSVVLDGLSCQHQECNMGNLIADAMVYHYAMEYDSQKHWTDAPIAIIQGGGIRSSIAHAEMPTTITKGDLIGVLPFEGGLVIVTMNGSVLLQMLEHSIENLNDLDYPGEFLQVSGLKVIYDVRQPLGSKVVKAEARCWNCSIPGYNKVIDNEIYNVIMPHFLSSGGDGYWMFQALPTRSLNYTELSCTIQYIKHHSPIYPEVENRVTILKQNSNKGFRMTLSQPLFLSVIYFIGRSLYISLGNHEFDEEIDGVVPFIRNLTSPILAANLILTDVPNLEKETNLHKSIVILKNAVKIGIIGYLTPETKFLAPKNNVEYEDEVIALKREVRKLKEKGIKIIIALGHSGFLKDLEIAEEVEDLDIVIGGHSNTFLINKNSTDEIPEYPQGPYPTIVRQKTGRKVLVVQAYAYTKYIGKLHLIFDDQGEIVFYDGEPILLNKEVPEDPKLLYLVNRYRTDVDQIYNNVVGTSSIFLDGDSCRLKECNLGNFINDAVINYTKQYYKEYSNVNIAITQGGRIRTSISGPENPIKITRGDMITVIPFTDTLCIITMNGTILRKALEHSVASWRKIDTPGQFLQYSGVQVVYDLAKKAGSRVVKAKAICSGCFELSDILDNLEYKVITSVFLGEGGDGYTMFESLPKEIVSYNEVTCAIEYLKKYSPIKPTVSMRIHIIHEDKIQSAKYMPSKAKSIKFNIKLFFVICSILLYS